MNMISVIGLSEPTINEGFGYRIALFCAGCSHKCNNCHNPKTWDINNGTFLPVQKVYDILDLDRDFYRLQGVTFTGGDPMFQAKAFCELAKMIRENTELDIWCYTGYLFEDIVNSQDEKYELLKLVDVLVDGQYIDELQDTTLDYRGSSNQRIIDVPESLKQNAAILLELDPF